MINAEHIKQITQSPGIWAHPVIWAMIFAESGWLIGVLLPGDSLLFTAGFLASLYILNIQFLRFGCLIAAVLGDNVENCLDVWHHAARLLFREGDPTRSHQQVSLSDRPLGDGDCTVAFRLALLSRP
jgi:membrane protein DedA with SNARE-associated domain